MRFIRKLVKFISLLLCLAFLCGCKAENSDESSAPAVEPIIALIDFTPRKTVSVSENGELSVSRKEIGDTPMGERGTWTIFVYMSGSSLETKHGGKGTEDMDEMLSGVSGKNVRFIVQTGGASGWKNDHISKDKLTRLEISDGKRKVLDELPLASMAEYETLRDFLQWGVENYPAEKMGIVFWGHGKGSIEGVCKDDLHRGNYLSLQAINAALSETAEKMTDKFEFAGFDACYMGTLEAADVLASYARYMIGSQELEAASGWNYSRLGGLLCDEPNADRESIAKAICDGFFDDSDEFAERSAIAVIDLSRIDGIITKLDALAEELCGAFDDREAVAAFESRLDLTEHFGEKNYYYGYSNIADLAQLAECTELAGAKELAEEIENAVVYKRMGKAHETACGLNIWYPFELDGIKELRTFSEIAVSPNYLALIDKRLRAGSPEYDTESYDPTELIGLWRACVNDCDHSVRGYWGGYSDEEMSGKSDFYTPSAFIGSKKGIILKDDGSYSVKVSPESLEMISSAELTLFKQSDESFSKYCVLGERPLTLDKETAEFSGKFDGKWFAMPDGTLVGIKQRGADKSVYAAGALMSGQDAPMKLTVDGEQETARLEGVFIKENGRSRLALPEKGDRLTAVYSAASGAGSEFSTITGAEFTFSSPQLEYKKLPDGKYFYMITVTDIFGGALRSDRVSFIMKGGKMTSVKINERGDLLFQ